MNGLTDVGNIARWDGTQWKKVGTGVTASLPQIYCMAVYKGDLYVGGNIYHAGTSDANFIARWDGTRWWAVGKGANYVVTTMVVDTVKDVLYIGGSFSVVDDTIECSVAQWDGTKWSRTEYQGFSK